MGTKITYNGKTTELVSGDIATLPCKDFTMATDVVVEAPESEGESAKLYGIEVTPTKDIQNIVPEGDFDGFNEVIVNPIPDEYVIPNLISKTFTKNGTYKASEENDGIEGTWIFNETIAVPSFKAEYAIDGTFYCAGGYSGLREQSLKRISFNPDGEAVLVMKGYLDDDEYPQNSVQCKSYSSTDLPSSWVSYYKFENGGGSTVFIGGTLGRTVTINTAEVLSGDVTVSDLLEYLKANATKQDVTTIDGYSEVIVNVPSGDVEEWDGSGVVIEEIATEEPEEPETESIIGTWVFNNGVADDLSTITPNTFSFNFTSNGNSYTSIVTQYGGEFGMPQMYYDSTLAYGGNTDTSWQNEAYKTINITSEPTDEAFITWLKANARKQGATLKTFNVMSGASTLYACQYEEGMTWQEFVDSEYNPDDSNIANTSGKIFSIGYVTSANNVICWSGGSTNGLYSINLRKYVTNDEVIGSDGGSNYEWGNPGNVGGAG